MQSWGKLIRRNWVPVLSGIFIMMMLAACATQEALPPPPQVDRTPPMDEVADFTGDYDSAVFQDWNDRTYYQIFVRSFNDSDGDGIGDLQGIIEKLDYLNDGDPETDSDLGISGIWLMPINESPSYHGYDVVDYYSIESDYGTMEDFELLLEEAEARGIKIIMDLVLNHSSSQHPWFIASKRGDPEFKDYYVWSDTDPGIEGPWGQQVWHNGGNGEYYYGVFWGGMPDLNYYNQEVNSKVNDIIRFWLEDVGVHGFRLDAIMYLKEEGNLLMNTFSNHEWFQEFHDFYKGINPDAFTIGEVWTNTEEVVKYIGNEVDTAFEFDLATAMLNSVRGGQNSDITAQQEKVNEMYPEGQYGRFLANHDQTRSATVLSGDLEKQKIAASLLLTGPGIPFLYYGEEVGVEGSKPDEHLRRPMHWTPRGGFTEGDPWQDYAAKLETRNVETMEDEPGSLLNRYRSLIQLRNDSPALRRGTLEHIPSSTRRVYAYFRYTPEESLLVVNNLGTLQEDYGLFLKQSPWAEGFALEPVYAATAEDIFRGEDAREYLDGKISQPVVNDQGGFEDFKVLGSLEARATYIFRVIPE
ncbi:alpha-amylase family glycosyl hydrolase [Salinispira pacifica]|uniref:Trehalose synthase n=1 Tax=Salinispira pacifica TaxID=1307761 RepID=V5WCQ0_9SPIO|nr:alpha-amylase family glycosyl hydrolase [Salinispira pacifica]AHC13547.1 Trehalose synthase [Salinispira pacifica]